MRSMRWDGIVSNDRSGIAPGDGGNLEDPFRNPHIGLSRLDLHGMVDHSMICLA